MNCFRHEQELLPLVEVLDGKRVRPRIRGRLTRHQEVSGQVAPPTAAQGAATVGKVPAHGAKKAAAVAAQVNGRASSAAGGAEEDGGPGVGSKRKAAAAASAPGTAVKTAGPQPKHREQRPPKAADGAKQAVRQQEAAATAAAAADSDSDGEDTAPADGERSFLEEVGSGCSDLQDLCLACTASGASVARHVTSCNVPV